MKRRDFITRTLTTAASTFVLGNAVAYSPSKVNAPAGATFKLNYAPHDGMFKNHAGENFVDQIKFMADQGFRGIEDNGANCCLM